MPPLHIVKKVSDGCEASLHYELRNELVNEIFIASPHCSKGSPSYSGDIKKPLTVTRECNIQLNSQ